MIRKKIKIPGERKITPIMPENKSGAQAPPAIKVAPAKSEGIFIFSQNTFKAGTKNSSQIN